MLEQPGTDYMNLLWEGLWCFPDAALKCFQTYSVVYQVPYPSSSGPSQMTELTDDCLWKKAALSVRKTSKYGIKYHSFVDGISLGFPPDMVCDVKDVWQLRFRTHRQPFKAVWVLWRSVSPLFFLNLFPKINLILSPRHNWVVTPGGKKKKEHKSSSLL